MLKSIRKFTVSGIVIGFGIVAVAVYLAIPRESLSACDQSDRPYPCLKEKTTKLFQQKGADTTLAFLGQQLPSNPNLQSYCHPLTHEIGHLGWEAKQDIAQAFQLATTNGSVCASGYYHGVMEAAVGELSAEKIVSSIPTICQPFASRPYSFNHYNCVHGLGHGLFAVRQDDWRAALEDCGGLADAWEQSACASGVFMQNVVNEINPIGHRFDFHDDDPLYPCSQTEDTWKPACYLNHSSHLLFLYAGDFQSVFTACAGVNNAEHRSVCFQSAGRDVSGRNRTDPMSVIRLCVSAKAGSKDCVIGAARDFVYYERGGRAATALCQQAPVTDQAACQAAVDLDVKSL